MAHRRIAAAALSPLRRRRAREPRDAHDKRPVTAAPAVSPSGYPERPLPVPGRQLVERHVLVHPDVLRQAQHAFGDDVPQDLVRAAGDPRSPARTSAPAGTSRGFGARSASMTSPASPMQVQRRSVAMSCSLRRSHQLADRTLRPRRLAARQRRHGAEAGVLQALRARHTSRRSSRAPPRSLIAGPPSSVDRARPAQAAHRQSGPRRLANREPLVHQRGDRRPSSPRRRAPSRWLSGTRTSVKKTSLKCDPPDI